MACKEIICKLDPSGSAAVKVKSHSAILNYEELKQETVDGWDTTSYC